jgi:Helix-turn-helix domain
MADEAPLTISVPEAGKRYFGLCRNAAYDAAARGEIPTIRIGRLLRVPVRALERMIERACELTEMRDGPRGRNHDVTCAHCGNVFKPLRQSARFCGSRCRVAAHRKTNCNANRGAKTPSDGPPALQSESGAHPQAPETKNALAATKTLSVTRRHSVVPDEKWARMYRLRLPDGSLTDMVSLTRAKETLR